MPRVPPHPVENETRYKLKAPNPVLKFRSHWRRVAGPAPRLRQGSARGRHIYLIPGALPRGRSSSPRPQPAQRGRLALLHPGQRERRVVLASAAPAAGGWLPGLTGSGPDAHSRRLSPPCARPRACAGRGARGRGRRPDTQAWRAGLGRPRGAGARGPTRPAPRPEAGLGDPAPPPPRDHSLANERDSRRPFPPPQAGRQVRSEGHAGGWALLLLGVPFTKSGSQDSRVGIWVAGARQKTNPALLLLPGKASSFSLLELLVSGKLATCAAVRGQGCRRQQFCVLLFFSKYVLSSLCSLPCSFFLQGIYDMD